MFMFSIRIKRFSSCVQLITGLLLIISFSAYAEINAPEWLDKPLNISFKNKPLKMVLREISEQTETSIAYDTELSDSLVSGNYSNVKLSDVISRLFRGKNKTIQVNKTNNTIIVKTFGAKSFIWTDSREGQDSLPQLTVEDLHTAHALQYKEYKERIANDNEILEGGLTRGEIKSAHQKQYSDYRSLSLSGDEELEGDITRREVVDLHSQQHANYQQQLANRTEVFDESGMTRDEISSSHKNQNLALLQNIDNNIDPLEGGLTREEIRTMHEQQATSLKKTLQEELVSTD